MRRGSRRCRWKRTRPARRTLLGLRERFVRDWPGPAVPPTAAPDPAFAEGWRVTALDEGVQASLVEALDPTARASFDALAADRVQLAAHLLEREAADRAIPVSYTHLTLPTICSV